MGRRGAILVVLQLACLPAGETPPPAGNDAGAPAPDVAADDAPGITAPTDSGDDAAFDSPADRTALPDGALDTVSDHSAPETAGDGGPAASRRDQVCARWRADRVDRAEGMFLGDVAQCMAGDIGPPGRANALKIVNLYRFLADMDPVVGDGNLDDKAQECSLMMSANAALSHTPPMTWKCYSAPGAEAAGRSNIVRSGAVAGVDIYMNDFGNETTLGHRRWLLSNSLGPIGIGSAPMGSCLWVIGGTGRAAKAWRAWPAPGPFPFAAVSAGGFGQRTLDTSGWSVQSDTINLGAATVTVTDNGQTLPVVVNQLMPNFGSRYAIRFVASGWTTMVGHTYRVQVDGVTPPISYEVEMVACP